MRRLVMAVAATAAAMVLTAAAPAPVRAQDQLPADSLALARQFTMWLYAGEVDSLVAHYAGERTPEDVRQRFEMATETLAMRAGLEIEVMEETWKMRNGSRQYWRTAQFTEIDEPLLVRWVINAEGKHTGIGIGPLSQAPPTDPAPE